MSERINNLEDRGSCMVLVGPEGLNLNLKLVHTCNCKDLDLILIL